MSAIAEAASVLLARGPGSAEVFVVRRAATLRFFGGFLAFPGGKVNPEDALRVAGQRFRKRFAELETAVAKEGLELKQLQPDELSKRWEHTG